MQCPKICEVFANHVMVRMSIKKKKHICVQSLQIAGAETLFSIIFQQYPVLQINPMSQNILQRQLSLHTGCPDTILIRRDFYTKSLHKRGINIPKLFNMSTEYIFDRFLELKGRFCTIRINTPHRDMPKRLVSRSPVQKTAFLRHCDVPHTVFSRTPIL